MQPKKLTPISFKNEADINEFITKYDNEKTDQIVVGVDGHSYWLSDICDSDDCDSFELLTKKKDEKGSYVAVSGKQVKTAVTQNNLKELELTRNHELTKLVDEIKETTVPGKLNLLAYKESVCSITFETFKDAVICPCGHSFDRKEINEHLNKKQSCPMDWKQLTKNDLRDNHALQQIISVCSLKDQEELEKQRKAQAEELAKEPKAQKDQQEKLANELKAQQAQEKELEKERQAQQEKLANELKAQQAKQEKLVNELKTQKTTLENEMAACKEKLAPKNLNKLSDQDRHQKQEYETFRKLNIKIIDKYEHLTDKYIRDNIIPHLQGEKESRKKQASDALSSGMSTLLVTSLASGGLIAGGFFTGGITWAVGMVLSPIIIPAFGVCIYKFIRAAVKKYQEHKMENRINILNTNLVLKAKCEAIDKKLVEQENGNKATLSTLTVRLKQIEDRIKLEEQKIQPAPAPQEIRAAMNMHNHLFHDPANNNPRPNNLLPQENRQNELRPR